MEDNEVSGIFGKLMNLFVMAFKTSYTKALLVSTENVKLALNKYLRHVKIVKGLC